VVGFFLAGFLTVLALETEAAFLLVVRGANSIA
jgi:hypothetical protein